MPVDVGRKTSFCPFTEIGALVTAVQLVVRRFEFCCRVKFCAEEGQESIAFVPDRTIVKDGKKKIWNVWLARSVVAKMSVPPRIVTVPE